MKIFIITLFILASHNTYAQWHCPWEYRQPMTIVENSNTTLSDYQIKIPLTYQSGMKTDFSDIRFTASDGTTLLSHWIEQMTSSSSATVWLKVPSLAANTTATVYLYYGNSSATDASDATSTFFFFDDFSVWSGWLDYGSGGVVQDNTSISGTNTLSKITNCDPNGGYKLMGNSITDFRLINREIRLDDGDNSCAWSRYGIEDASYNGYNIRRNAAQNNTGAFGYEHRTGGTGSNSNTSNFTNPQDNWYRTELTRCSASSNNISATLYSDDRSLIGTITGTDTQYNSFDRLTIRGGQPYYVDFMAVANYTCNEPTYSFGTVEENFPTAICKNITVDLDASGSVTINAIDVDNGSSDDCGIASMTLSQSTFDCDDLGDQTIILTVTNIFGNIATCDATITIEDNLAPIISCPSDITITATEAGCSASVTWVAPFISENCGSIPFIDSNYVPGQNFTIGTTTVTYDIDDGNGNSASCSFNVTVIAPTLSPTITINETSGNVDHDGMICNGDSVELIATTGFDTYSWSSGDITNNTTLTNSGTYTVTISNSIGCTASVSESVTVLTNPTAGTCNVVHDKCQEGTGSVTLQAKGGTAPYEFEWTPNVGTTSSSTITASGNQANITNIPGGTTINISVVDANGCSAN